MYQLVIRGRKISFDLSFIAGIPEQQSKELNFIPKPEYVWRPSTTICIFSTIKLKTHCSNITIAPQKLVNQLIIQSFLKKNEKFDYLKKLQDGQSKLKIPVRN